MKHEKIIFIGVIVLLGIITPLIKLQGEENLKIEFIEKALKHQELKASPGISVKYNVAGYKNGKKMPGEIEVIYIKTLDKRFLKEKIFYNEKLILITSTVYEENNDSWKSISILTKNEKAAGSIGNGIAPCFLKLDIMETTKYPVPGFNFKNGLLEMLKKRKLKITSEKEIIDKKEMFLLEISEPDQNVKSCKIYLDPEIDFCPVLIIAEVNQVEYTIKFQNYKDIGNGTYFPMKMNMISKGKEEIVEKLFTVKEAYAGKPIKEDISVEFPSGIQVYDDNTGKYIKIK